MIVDFPNGSQQDIQLYTLDGTFGVHWLDGVGVVRDDSQKVYGPFDVFRDAPDPNGGTLYQLGSDYHIRPYGAPTTPGPTITPSAPAGRSVSGTATPVRNTANVPANVSTDPNVRAAGGTAGTLGTFFGQNLVLGHGFAIPYWLLGLGGVALMVQRRRRHR